MTNKGLEQDKLGQLLSLIEKIGKDEFIYPDGISAKHGVALNLIRDFLILLASEGVLEIYTIPELRGNLLREYSRKGLILDPKKFTVVDPDDFNEVDSGELKLLTAYKKKAC